MTTKTKLILSAIASILIILFPIKPLCIGLVLCGISGFSTGWYLMTLIIERMKENDKDSI